MNKQVCLVGLIILSLLIWVGCSDDDSPTGTGGGTTADSSIGPEGGTVQIAGNISLTIPAGALADTVDFSIDANPSPAPFAGSLGPASTCYTIEPPGTNFSSPATVTITYNPATVADAGEHTVGLYTDEGGGWSLLTTVRDTVNNTVTGPVSHLSDFAAAGDTTQTLQGDGIFAELVVGRTILTMIHLFKVDAYTVRLDSSYAPCDPIQPIGGATITCGDSTLYWVSEANQYIASGVGLIDTGATYTFHIAASGGIPALEDSITFPTLEPQLVFPTDGQSLSASSNVNVTWTGSGSGMIDIIIISDAGDSVFYVQTENDGSYTIENAQMTNPLGECMMMLSYYNRKPIDAVGYDPRSFIAGRVMHNITIHFVDDSK